MLQSRLPMVSIYHMHIVFDSSLIALLGSNKEFVDILSFYITILQLFMYKKVALLSFTQDYYGVPFPGTTATLPGRDGLGNNPYSSKSHLLVVFFFKKWVLSDRF